MLNLLQFNEAYNSFENIILLISLYQLTPSYVERRSKINPTMWKVYDNFVNKRKRV